MNTLITAMLAPYNCHAQQEYENALKEIIQEFALLGLWRSKFFEKAAFYGGTALRILYGLNRFSEDLDFSLLSPNPNFSLTQYNEAIEAELNGAGLDVIVTTKEKKPNATIQSAFIKAETLTQFMLINLPASLCEGMPKSQQMKIKIEVDTNPPPGFLTEVRTLTKPASFNVLTYQKPDLFAGKIHAILCRPWAIRIKGRDWYDLIWYIANNTPVRLTHLQERLWQTHFLEPGTILTKEMLLDALKNKINTLDVEMAKKDILSFIRDPMAVAVWSKNFFSEAIEKLLVI